MDELSAYMQTNLGPAAAWTSSSAQRYSTIIRAFLTGVGLDVLRTTLVEAASKAGCSIQSFLYKNRIQIKYLVSQHKLSGELCLVYPPENTDVDIQRWNCRLLCLVLKATDCLDARGHDDVCLIERMYRRHFEDEYRNGTIQKPVLASKQQPKPKREWIRTCAAIQRLVENTGDTSLLSSVRNFICKIEMGGKTMDARIETHISLAKMISELAASHTKGSTKEDQALRKHIGELTKLQQQYDAVSKPTFSTSRSLKNLSRTMVADGREIRSLSRPNSDTSLNSNTQLGQNGAKPFMRSDIIDSTKTGNGTAKTNRPFPNTSLGSDRFRSASLVTPKLSHSRTYKQPEEEMPDKESSWENVAKNPAINTLKEKQQVNLDPENDNVLFRSKNVPDSNEKLSYTRDAQVVFACPKVLERSGSSKINKTVTRPHSFDVAEGNISVSRHSAEVSNHRNSRHSQNVITSRHHQHGRVENDFTPVRPNSFDVSRMSRTVSKRPTVVNNDLSLSYGSYVERLKSSIKERQSNIMQIYSQSLTIKPSNQDKHNHIEKPPFSPRSHMQQSILEKQQDAKLIVSQPAFSSLVAYTSKYHRHQKQNKESQNNATDDNTKIETDQPEIVSDPNEEDKEADFKEESEPSIQEEPVIDTPQEQPAQSRSRFGKFKDMLKNAIKVKRPVDTRQILDDDSKQTSSKVTASDKVTSVDENGTGDPTKDTSLRGHYSPEHKENKNLSNNQYSTCMHQEDTANDSIAEDEKAATVKKNDETGELKKKNSKVHFLPSRKVNYKPKSEKKGIDPLPDSGSQGKEKQHIDDVKKYGNVKGTSKSVTITSTKAQPVQSQDKTNKKLGVQDDRDHAKPNMPKEKIHNKTNDVEEDNSLDDTIGIHLPNQITDAPDVSVSETNNQPDASTSLPMENIKTTATHSSAIHETKNQKATFAPKRKSIKSDLSLNSVKTMDSNSEKFKSNPESNPTGSKETKSKKGKPAQKSKKVISNSSNKKSPHKNDKQSDKVTLLESTEVYEEDSDTNESITIGNGNVDNDIRATLTEEIYNDNDETKTTVTNSSNKALEIPTLKNKKGKIPNEEDILGIEEDPDADMKRLANDVIVHNQVHKAAREFMEKDKAFADEFFSFLHRHKATKEFLRTEQFSAFKTIKLSNGAKAALSFLHAFTFRHVNVFDRDYCKHVVEKILKKTECEDARMAKKKEDEIISRVKAEVKTRKRTPFHNTKLITKDTVEKMRNKRVHQNGKSSHKEDTTNQLEDPEDKRPISALERLHNIAECRCWKCRHKDLAMTIAVNWRNHDLCRLYLSYGVKFKMEHLLPAVRANDADNVKEIVGYLKRRFEWDEENEDARMALILARFHNMPDIVGYLEMEGVQDERIVQCACFA